MAGNAGVSQQSEAVQRKFEVLYLDERVRVVRFLPETDSESEPQLFVFEREVEDAEDDVEVRLLSELSSLRVCLTVILLHSRCIDDTICRVMIR